LRTRLTLVFCNSQLKMRMNMRYCTCAWVRDTGTVLKRLSVWSCYYTDSTQATVHAQTSACLHQSQRML